MLILAGGAALFAVLVHQRVVDIPRAWNPWEPLVVADPPNILTRYKLDRLDREPAECMAVLAGATVRFASVPDRDAGNGCAIRNAVRIDATSAQVGAPFTLTCRSAVALAMWETHGLQPVARRHFGKAVARIEHYGSYACRNIYGADLERRSQHATADALDVAAFVLDGGHRVRVRDGWSAGDADARFLRDAHAQACRFFDAVLGPDYNAAHHDHFHLDRGPFRACR